MVKFEEDIKLSVNSFFAKLKLNKLKITNAYQRAKRELEATSIKEKGKADL